MESSVSLFISFVVSTFVISTFAVFINNNPDVDKDTLDLENAAHVL